MNIPIIEVIILVCFLGSFTFIIGNVFFFYLLKRRNVQKKGAYCILHNLITIVLSFYIFTIWNLKIDVMFYFIFLPTVLAEIIVISLFYYWLTKSH